MAVDNILLHEIAKLIPIKLNRKQYSIQRAYNISSHHVAIVFLILQDK